MSTFNDQATPLDVTGLQSGGTAASATCVVVSGAVRCWEQNPGDGTDDEPLTARTVTGITDAVQVSAGSHSCAVTATGAIKCPCRARRCRCSPSSAFRDQRS